MDLILIIGVAAGIITSASFIPQLIKGYQTKKLDDVSIGMYLILIVGMGLWLYYGILLKETPIIGANAFSIICCSLVLVLKQMYSRKTR
jgi:MtN3 and saliva related transmembrane protein